MPALVAMRRLAGLSRFARSLAYAAGVTLALGMAFGPRGYGAGCIGAFLFIVWRHDTPLGTCLPLAVLLVFVMLVMVALIGLMALHR